jgi:hypothetical protein
VDASNPHEWLNAFKYKTPFIKRRDPKKGRSYRENDNGESLLSMPLSIFANNFWHDHETDKFL